MKELNSKTGAEFLRRFERFGGALIAQVFLDLVSRSVELRFEAFDALDLERRRKPVNEQYKVVVLRMEDVTEFAVLQTIKESKVLLVDGVELVWIEGRVFFIGDPPYPGERSASDWTTDLVRQSTFYLGGSSCSWAFGEAGSTRS